MGSLWRDSLQGAASDGSSQDAVRPDRATALLVGFEPTRAIGLVRLLAPMARAQVSASLSGALELARARRPDVVLIGNAVQDADALGALVAFQADAELEDLPIIVVAAGADDKSELAALRRGALAWLPHTVAAEALLSRVRLALRLHKREPLQWGKVTPVSEPDAHRSAAA